MNKMVRYEMYILDRICWYLY